MYEEIKKNLIINFLNPFYLWACCVNKNSILENIKERCPFKTDIIGDDGNIIHMNLGDNIILSFNLKWEERIYDNNIKNKIVNYRLVSIT